MRKRMITISICLYIFLSFSFTYAQEAELKRKLTYDFIIGAGGTFGGDKLAEYSVVKKNLEFSYTWEDESSVKAGNGAQLFLGSSLYFTTIPLELQITCGWSIDRTTDVDDLDSKFTRYPVDIFLNYQLYKMRMGVGLRYNINPTFIEDFYDIKIKFDNALGYFIDIGYLLRPNFIISGRYTIIEYSYGDSPIKINGENIGLFVSIVI